MPKTVNIEQTPTSFFLPVDDLRMAFACVLKDRTRFYICGLFIDTANRELIALDGIQLLTVNLSCDTADKAFKARASGGDLWVYGDTKTGILQLVARFAGNTEYVGIDCPRCYNPALLTGLIEAGANKGRAIKLTGSTIPDGLIGMKFADVSQMSGRPMPVPWRRANAE